MGESRFFKHRDFSSGLKPSRNLTKRYEIDNGIVWRTIRGKSVPLQDDEAFIEINRFLGVMLRRGRMDGQSDKAYSDLYLYLLNNAYVLRKKVESVDLIKQISLLCESVRRGEFKSCWYMASQAIFFYAQTLIERKEKEYMFFLFQIANVFLFEMYLKAPVDYRNLIRGFYWVFKGEKKAMPEGYFDLSYNSGDNDHNIDIYYLVISDFFANKAMELQKEDGQVYLIDDMWLYHKLYSSFREKMDYQISRKRKTEKKEIWSIYKSASKPSSNNAPGSGCSYVSKSLLYTVGKCMGYNNKLEKIRSEVLNEFEKKKVQRLEGFYLSSIPNRI